TNHTGNDYFQNDINLDVFKVPHPIANATSSYSLTSGDISLAIAGHVRISNRLYAIAGVDYSTVNSASFSAHQDLSGGRSYYRQDTHNESFLYSLDEPKVSFLNFLENVRTDALAGVGGTYRIGTGNLILDA